MWLLTTLLILLIFLIILVIISTSMKIGLIITNRHNYDSRKLIIPSILIMIIWMIAILTFYLIFKNTFSNGLEDMILTLVMTPSSITNKKDLIIVGVILTIITILIQSFTYYAINIDYKKMFGYIRFKVKQKLMEENNDLKVYRNVYQKLLLRTRRNPMNDEYEKEFIEFKKKNAELKEKISNGKLTQEEYMKWLNEQ